MTFPHSSQPYPAPYNHGPARAFHPELGPWTPLDLVHCSNRKLDAEFFSSRCLSIHKRIVIRNFLSILYQLQPLDNDYTDFSSSKLQLNLHAPPSNGQSYQEDYDDYDYDQEPSKDQWMKQTLSAAGVTPSAPYVEDDAPTPSSSTPSDPNDLNSPMLEWMNSSSEPILSRAAAAAASAVTSRRRPQSLRSSRIPLPRPQSTELPQSLHSYLSTVFDVDWSIKVPTTEDALFTSKTSTSRLSRTSETLSYALSNLSLHSSLSSSFSPSPPSPSVDRKGMVPVSVQAKSSLDPSFLPPSSSSSTSSSCSANIVRHSPMQGARIGLQGQSSSSSNQHYQETGSRFGLCESKSSSIQEEGVATKTPLSSWEQSALQRQSVSNGRDPQQQQLLHYDHDYDYNKDQHQNTHRHQHHQQQQQQQLQEQHIHNHIHIHVHTYVPPISNNLLESSPINTYTSTPQTRSPRYPSPSPAPPRSTAQQKYQHQLEEPYPSIAVAGPLAPYSSSQQYAVSASSSQYPPEKASTAEQGQPYLATSPPSLPPTRSRSQYPRSPPPPPYSPSITLATDIAEIADSLLYPRAMKQIQGPPMAPRHLQSAAARKEYQRYEEQQKMFKREDETKDAESQGFLRLLSRQSSKRKPSISTISISAPIPVVQPIQWQDRPQPNRRNSREPSSAKSAVNNIFKGTFSSGKASRSRVSLPIAPPVPAESLPFYPPRTHQAPLTLSISAAQP